jgi:hypothetical protein
VVEVGCAAFCHAIASGMLAVITELRIVAMVVAPDLASTIVVEACRQLCFFCHPLVHFGFDDSPKLFFCQCAGWGLWLGNAVEEQWLGSLVYLGFVSPYAAF